MESMMPFIRAYTDDEWSYITKGRSQRERAKRRDEIDAQRDEQRATDTIPTGRKLRVRMPDWVTEARSPIALERIVRQTVRAASDGKITRDEARDLVTMVAGEVFDAMQPDTEPDAGR